MMILILFLTTGVTFGFDFFHSDIDYWKDNRVERPSSTARAEVKNPETKFDWSKHMDPKNEEFFREGDHLPPAPFMEVMRDPSDENLRNWFAYIGKKNDLSKNLHEKMQTYLAQNKSSDAKTDTPPLKPPPLTSDLAERFRFRFYFHSLCHHCKRMIETVNGLQAQGFFVEGFQIDREQRNLPPMHFALQPANEADLKARDIASWPVLFVGDLKNKKVFRINGYKSLEEIREILTKV